MFFFASLCVLSVIMEEEPEENFYIIEDGVVSTEPILIENVGLNPNIEYINSIESYYGYSGPLRRNPITTIMEIEVGKSGGKRKTEEEPEGEGVPEKKRRNKEEEKEEESDGDTKIDTDVPIQTPAHSDNIVIEMTGMPPDAGMKALKELTIMREIKGRVRELADLEMEPNEKDLQALTKLMRDLTIFVTEDKPILKVKDTGYNLLEEITGFKTMPRGESSRYEFQLDQPIGHGGDDFIVLRTIMKKNYPRDCESEEEHITNERMYLTGRLHPSGKPSCGVVFRHNDCRGRNVWTTFEPGKMIGPPIRKMLAITNDIAQVTASRITPDLAHVTYERGPFLVLSAMHAAFDTLVNEMNRLGSDCHRQMRIAKMNVFDMEYVTTSFMERAREYLEFANAGFNALRNAIYRRPAHMTFHEKIAKMLGGVFVYVPPLFLVHPPHADEPPIPVDELLHADEPPIPVVEPPIPVVEPPIPVVEPQLPVAEPPLPVAEPPLPVVEQPDEILDIVGFNMGNIIIDEDGQEFIVNPPHLGDLINMELRNRATNVRENELSFAFEHYYFNVMDKIRRAQNEITYFENFIGRLKTDASVPDYFVPPSVDYELQKLYNETVNANMTFEIVKTVIILDKEYDKIMDEINNKYGETHDIYADSLESIEEYMKTHKDISEVLEVYRKRVVEIEKQIALAEMNFNKEYPQTRKHIRIFWEEWMIMNSIRNYSFHQDIKEATLYAIMDTLFKILRTLYSYTEQDTFNDFRFIDEGAESRANPMTRAFYYLMFAFSFLGMEDMPEKIGDMYRFLDITHDLLPPNPWVMVALDWLRSIDIKQLVNPVGDPFDDLFHIHFVELKSVLFNSFD